MDFKFGKLKSKMRKICGNNKKIFVFNLKSKQKLESLEKNYSQKKKPYEEIPSRKRFRNMDN